MNIIGGHELLSIPPSLIDFKHESRESTYNAPINSSAFLYPQPQSIRMKPTSSDLQLVTEFKGLVSAVI